MDQNFAMSVSPQEFEDAKRDYVSTIPDVDLLRNQLRELNKKQKRKDVIFKYMCENELEELLLDCFFRAYSQGVFEIDRGSFEDLVSDAAQLEQIRADHNDEVFRWKSKKKTTMQTQLNIWKRV